MNGMLLCLSAISSLLAAGNCAYQPNWDSLDARLLPAWYDEAKVGVFPVWGLYSVPSIVNEWFWYDWKVRKNPEIVEYMEKNYPARFTYADFAPMFKAEMYDPNAWADLFAKSGAKYVVPTTKHHSGYTLWPTNTSWNWNTKDTGPHRDLIGDLASAVRNRTTLKYGLYFSLFEWFNPLFLQDQANGFKTQDYVREVSLPQLHELVNAYNPEVIFSDGDWSAPDTYWNSTQFLAWLYNSSPVKDTVVVNDRWGQGCGCKHGGYFDCHDRYNPRKLLGHKWENAMTLDRKSWGYRREAGISEYLTASELLEELVTTVSCGGNLLVSVGPSADGRILPIMEERLLQMGQWLKTNGEAIYASKPWEYQNDTVTNTVWYTYNTTTKAVYAISLVFPDDYSLTLGDIQTSVQTQVSLLGYGKVEWRTSGSGMVVTIPYLPLDSPLQWAWTLKLEKVSARRSISTNTGTSRAQL